MREDLAVALRPGAFGLWVQPGHRGRLISGVLVFLDRAAWLGVVEPT